MLIKAKALKGYKLHAVDGEIGSVTEFVFDDHQWTVRYLVAETGTWLLDRQVLISTAAITATEKETKHIAVNLTKQQIEGSPLLYKEMPLTRHYEITMHQYYGFPPYWNNSAVITSDAYMMSDTAAYKSALQGDKPLVDMESGLRSTDNVTGRKIHATDGEIGHIVDFILDDETWVIRYLDVDTVNWWPSKHVLISPQWIDRIGWEEFKVYAHVTREKIKHAPEYSERTELTREYEHNLHEHYDVKGYWND